MICPPPCPPPWWPRALLAAAAGRPDPSLASLLSLPVRLEGGDIVISVRSHFRRDYLHSLLPELRRRVNDEADRPTGIRIELKLPTGGPAVLDGSAVPRRPAGHGPLPRHTGAAPGRRLNGSTATPARLNGRALRAAGSASPPAPPPGAQGKGGRRALPFNFESFVAGRENELALAAVQCVAGGRQPEANPIYLASASGMGKSHLMWALMEDMGRGGAQNLACCTAGEFTRQFTQAVRRHDTEGFHRHYRGLRLLVLEDVQRLPRGKNRATQLELIQAIEHLCMMGQRVVLTGDRMPREIEHLDASLASHMASGLVIEIEPPGLELRRNILRDKASRLGLRIPDDCLDELAERALGSVRDLEGVVKQLNQFAMLSTRRQSIDIELIHAALRKISPSADLPLEPDQVIGCICKTYKVSLAQLRSKSRLRGVLEARQMAMYLCHHYCGASYSRIGRALGRHHSAVRNAVEKIAAQLDGNERMRLQIEQLSRLLKSRRWPPPA